MTEQQTKIVFEKLLEFTTEGNPLGQYKLQLIISEPEEETEPFDIERPSLAV